MQSTGLSHPSSCHSNQPEGTCTCAWVAEAAGGWSGHVTQASSPQGYNSIGTEHNTRVSSRNFALGGKLTDQRVWEGMCPLPHEAKNIY